MTALLGSSLALCISDIPFDGPVAGVVVGRVDGKFIVNPTVEELEQSDINLSVAGTKDAINMVESGSKEVSESDMIEALMVGHEAIKKLVSTNLSLQDKFMHLEDKKAKERIKNEIIRNKSMILDYQYRIENEK